MIYQGDCLDILPALEPKSIQCCVTSPPYYGLRDYGCDGQIGLETTPEAYVEKLVAVFREVRRVLADDGTLWLNLGDSYSTPKEGNTEIYKNPNLVTSSFKKKCPANLKPKNLIGIPWRVAFALQTDGWYLRQDIIWAKPNPMPESVTDRCTKSHEYIFLLTKSARYYYDQDSIREPHKRLWDESNGGSVSTGRMVKCGGAMGDMSSHPKGYPLPNVLGANKRSVWTVNTQTYKEAHFATFPEEIPRTCILAGSKKGDTILDPFSGAGTTGVVAEKLNRKYIGIELNPQYTKMAEDRIYNVQPLFAGLEL